MTGRKRKGAQIPGDSEAIEEETEMSLKKKMTTAMRELHRTQRRLNTLAESGEITAGNSDDILESLDQLTERLNAIGESLSETISDLTERDELLIELGQIEKDARESVRFANKMIREKLIAATENIQRSDEVSQAPTEDGRTSLRIDWGAHGLKSPSLPVFSGDQRKYEDWKNTFDAFVGNEKIPEKFKMIQLRSCLAGEPLRLVERYSPTEVGYSKARNELDRKYGGAGRRIRYQLEEIRQLRPVRHGSYRDLEDLADRVQSLVTNLEEHGCAGDLSDISAYYILVQEKLPASYLKSFKRWVQNQKKADSFTLFASWLSDEAICERDAQEMSGARSGHREQEDRKKTKARHDERHTFKKVFNARSGGYEKENRQTGCTYCSGEHKLEHCPMFCQWTVGSRYHFCKANGVCFRCLSGFHQGRNCRRYSGCSVTSCGGSHHTLLHAEAKTVTCPEGPTEGTSTREIKQKTNANASQVFTTERTAEESNAVAFQTVPVKLSCESRCVIVNALLDPCSDANFVTKTVAEELGLSGTIQEFELGTVQGSKKVAMKKSKVKMSSLDENFRTELSAFVIDDLSSASTTADWNSMKFKWDHLRTLPFPEVATKQGADMLIGLTQNTTPLFIPLETVRGGEYDPVGIRTPLGWTAFGPLGDENRGSVNRIMRTHVKIPKLDEMEATLEASKQNKEEIEAMKSMTRLDLLGVQNEDEESLSHEEKVAMKKMKTSMKYDGERYEVAVPWREDRPNLHGNYDYASKRMKKTEESLKKTDGKLLKEYDAVFEDYVSKGYMKKLEGDERKAAVEDGWFLPHFPVIRSDQSTTKVRVVYDAAAKYHGRSLNSELYAGPSICNDLIEVLLGFRRHLVALTGDVKEMFLQVKLPAEDQKFHRVLWRHADQEQGVDIYQANRWLFGNAAAPFAAQFVVKENAIIHKAKFPAASKVVEDSFYMDDAITSFEDVGTAVEARTQLTELMEKAGMKIRKWMSSHAEVMKSIPSEDRADQSSLTIEEGCTLNKTLGVIWNAHEDTLSINSSFKTKEDKKDRTTKRTCLKTLASVFDPLCLCSPFTITGRLLFQETWQRNLGWDEDLPADLQQTWRRWEFELRRMETVTVPRCLHSFEKVSRQEIHVFSDASESAYAAVIYVVSQRGDKRTSRLAMSRARVAPKSRKVSIPRLELMGALLGVRLVKKVCKMMDIPIADVFFWSDSLNVLCWIRNDVSRFQSFVAHRVSEIRDSTDPSQWQHVPGTSNPADLPTRGQTLDEMKESRLWWEGPSFLCETADGWPERRDFMKESFDKSEDRRTKCVVKNTQLTTVMNRLDPSRFSSWVKLIRVTAYVLRFVSYLKKTSRHELQLTSRASSVPPLDPSELKTAELFWIKQSQNEFEKEKQQLITQCADASTRNHQKKLKDSSIRRLSPFIDEDGILRVGGRVQRSDMPFEAKHPALLPKRHDVTRLIIEQIHKDGDHEMGVEHTVSELRQRFWVIAAREAVKRTIRTCPTCVRRRSMPEAQQMGSKPKCHLELPYSPFKQISVDFAGPFETRQGRGKTRQKRYLCVFYCLHTKAVHLELAYGLDTDSFLRAFMRFIARRGRPSHVTSDNATNFVGANKEIRKLLHQLDEAEIQDKTAHLYIKWQFIPPGAPHFNGGCEAMVKCAKRALRKTLLNANLTDEELQTAFCQAEALLNSRPITAVSSDPNDGPPLTPSSFLLGHTEVDLTLSSCDEGSSLRRRWQRLEQLNQEFWRRWVREYLPSLQGRQKWTEASGNVQKDETVLLVDPSVPRGSWPLGRITNIFPGPDGLVRVVEVKTSKGIYRRPVTKIVRLELEK